LGADYDGRVWEGRMVRGFDDLVEFVLEKIALRGKGGEFETANHVMVARSILI